MPVTRLISLAAILAGLTAAGWTLASSGVGLDETFQDPISIRDGSVGGDRVYVGGGLHGGK